MGPKTRNSNRQAFMDTPYKLYAGNLGWGLTSQGLRDAFSEQSGVLSAKVVYDKDSGKSRGFGFISFSSAEDAQSAFDVMNGVATAELFFNVDLLQEEKSIALKINNYFNFRKP
ncbi:hypothetical protein Sjap_008617 [Stephania japonica]|uniref:RRM domain-containing protein n=1 Tax=Stephania japonica TaxID=461633 RepID=A0AAP0PB17_9MAGN